MSKTRFAGRDGARTLAGTTEMVFNNGVGIFDPTGSAENVARLYGAALDRAPDVVGLNAWTNAINTATLSLETIASDFAVSPEFIQDYGNLSNSAFVNQLYENVLGRPADATGAQSWDNALASGMSRGAVILGFAESQEYKADKISVYGDENNSEALRLYQAAFNRAPDSTGLAYWSAAMASDSTPTQVAQDFINSIEFQQNYGALTVDSFVSTMYQNVLHRAGEAIGIQYWTNELNDGMSRASVLVGFSDGLENRINTAYSTHANWVFIPS